MTAKPCSSKKSASASVSSVPLVVIEKVSFTPCSSASSRARRVVACTTGRLTSGSPPRNARLSRAPGLAPSDQKVDRAVGLLLGSCSWPGRRTRPAGHSSRCSRDCTSAPRQATARECRAAPAVCRRSAAGRRGRCASARSRLVWAAACDRSTEFTEQPGLDVEQAAAVGYEQMPSERRLDQVGVRGRATPRRPCSGGRRRDSLFLVLLRPARSVPASRGPPSGTSATSPSAGTGRRNGPGGCPRSRPARTRRSAPSAASCRPC